MEIPTTFKVKVTWNTEMDHNDTDDTEVELPAVVYFNEEVSSQIQEQLKDYLLEDPTTNQHQDFDNQIIKHLEDLTGWLVEEFHVLSGEDEDENSEDENEWFKRKYPRATCHTCDCPVNAATVVYCGGASGCCETWFCKDCHVYPSKCCQDCE